MNSQIQVRILVQPGSKTVVLTDLVDKDETIKRAYAIVNCETYHYLHNKGGIALFSLGEAMAIVRRIGAGKCIARRYLAG